MSRSRAVFAAAALVALSRPAPATGQAGVFLSEPEAPRAVFPQADRLQRREIPVTAELRKRLAERLGRVRPSMWEKRFVVFDAWQGDTFLGRAIIVEEIGKHRPITFVVGIDAAGRVADVAVMAYREAYGGEIRHPRFLSQFRGRTARDRFRGPGAVRNIAGATLSVRSAVRAVQKALALNGILEAQPPPAAKPTP